MTSTKTVASILVLAIGTATACYVATTGSQAGVGRSEEPDLPTVVRQPVRVELSQTDSGAWQLTREGNPYYIKGAGGPGSLELLARCGANSSRTWGVDNIDESRARLDEAYRNGISVAFGIWIEHERHGFDYHDEALLAKQVERTLSHVRRFKDHPAILVWGIGNEMEGGNGTNPLIWNHIEQIASLIRKEDPNHPVMTVVAEIGGEKVRAIHEYCPSVDIIGINSYGGTDSLPERYRDAGGSKPYIVTEFGPNGPWEVGQNSIGAVEEPTSTSKAGKYGRSFNALKADSKLCLGSYAFLWGHKQEATATWFGMFLEDGRKTAAVDTLTDLWGGPKPENRCPDIHKLTIDGPDEVDASSVVAVTLEASDPDGDTLETDWVLMEEAGSMVTGGDFQESPVTIFQAKDSRENETRIKAPEKPGVYRVYAYVGDGKDGSAVANVPFRVRQTDEKSIVGDSTTMPHVVYDEPDHPASYYPSGWMGSAEAITMDEKCTDNPKSGDHCLKFGYSISGNWGGVVWQNPPNDWGDKPGGFDLSEATRLTFWARGENGGETMKFGFGLLGRDKVYWDTGKKETGEIALTQEWKQYTIDLKDLNLKRIKTGFYWTLAGQGKPITFYLDRIVFENGK
jgi:hypothetical protein